MFERYTEKARRVIFYARYESSTYGSPCIETEHILLGFVREAKVLLNAFFPEGAAEQVRAKVSACATKRPTIPTSVDLPLSNESKSVLAYAAEEMERLASTRLGTEHLLLGLLREDKSFAAHILHELGLEVSATRIKLADAPELCDAASARLPRVPAARNFVRIHHFERDVDQVQLAVSRCRETSWHWEKRTWRPRDIVVERGGGRISFDLSLGNDSTNYELMKDGWKQDRCIICRWTLFGSDDPEHSEVYSNGRDYVCVECYDKFLGGPDYFAGMQSENNY